MRQILEEEYKFMHGALAEMQRLYESIQQERKITGHALTSVGFKLEEPEANSNEALQVSLSKISCDMPVLKSADNEKNGLYLQQILNARTLKSGSLRKPLGALLDPHDDVRVQ